MKSVSYDDVRKRLLENPHCELAVKGVLRPGLVNGFEKPKTSKVQNLGFLDFFIFW